MRLPEGLYPDYILNSIDYKPLRYDNKNLKEESIDPIGFDTEAYQSGRPFMFCTSRGHVFRYSDIPDKLFSRELRNGHFVVYNLRYDSGAILHHLPAKELEQLRDTDETEYSGYVYKVLANKMLSITKGKNSVTFWDIFGFYLTSLDKASRTYLQEGKIAQDTTLYDYKYVKRHWEDISKYCIQDALLTEKLARVIIEKFEAFGVYPQKLYSTAYVSWQYFRKKCDYIHVKRQWYNNPRVLEYALRSYCGGKFEVTRKGPGYYYEYDIVSAYPNEIANLVDIRQAKHCHSAKYQKRATYGFLLCQLHIPQGLFSPVPIKKGNTNIYPEGNFVAYITKNEYDYLKRYGATIHIIDAEWLFIKNKVYPYRREILRLMYYKKLYKEKGKMLDYHTIKLFLNSFYGKMIQMIEKEDVLETGAAWNPIYASVITANCRIRVSELQQKYPSIVAVHTDSVISTEPLPIETSKKLGAWDFEIEGEGLILGSGVYQIANKSRFRGFRIKDDLQNVIATEGSKQTLHRLAPLSWRQVAFRGMDKYMINYFADDKKVITPSSDYKRVWIDDYTDFSEIRHKNVESVAYYIDGLDDKLWKW